MDAFKGKMERKLVDGLTVVGSMGVSWASDKLRQNGSVVTSNLINSLTYSTRDEGGPLNGSPTNGERLSKPEELAVKIGTTVVYAPRVEFGFSGTDSLGRNYNQPAKSFLRAGIEAHRNDVLAIMVKANG